MKQNPYLLDGKFGLERETLRVDACGRLAQTEHPFQNVQLTRDFCENQLEIVTPVCENIPKMMSVLEQLDREARNTLFEMGETLWLYSNPPHIDSEKEIPVARFRGKSAFKTTYRQNLERRYGKRLMLYSGIHFNFSFSLECMQEWYQNSGSIAVYDAFQNEVYLRLFRQLNRYSWLLVFLTAASPVYDASFDGDGKNGMVFDGYGSMRSGERGYWNQFIPELDYTSLAAYTDRVQFYLQKGLLFSAGELYLPVRLKPRGENSLAALRNNGVNHIELRMFDLNPLEPLGVAQKDLEFAHLLMLYLLELEDCVFTPQLQVQAIYNHKAAARYALEEAWIDSTPILEKVNHILQEMRQMFADVPYAIEVISYAANKLNGVRQCELVKSQMNEDAFLPMHTVTSV